jgi:hypothetical protein
MASQKSIGLLHREPPPVKTAAPPVEPPTLAQQLALEQQHGGAIRRFALPGKREPNVPNGRYRIDGGTARRLIAAFDPAGKV